MPRWGREYVASDGEIMLCCIATAALSHNGDRVDIRVSLERRVGLRPSEQQQMKASDSEKESPSPSPRGPGTWQRHCRGWKGDGHIPAPACEGSTREQTNKREQTGAASSYGDVRERRNIAASPFAGGRGRAAAAGRHGVGDGDGKRTHCGNGELAVAGVADPLGTVALAGHSEFPCAAFAAKD